MSTLGTGALCAATLFFSLTGPARADRHITPPAPSAGTQPEGLGDRIGSLRGTARNALGELVGGAVVTLAGHLERTARTDSTGSFSFVGLAPGSYPVYLESPDTPSPAQSIEIGSRESIVALTLGRSSTSLVTIILCIWKRLTKVRF